MGAGGVRTQQIPLRYPYFVPRVGTYGVNLPVYSDVRRGGDKWLTIIRKVEGDAPVCVRSAQ